MKEITNVLPKGKRRRSEGGFVGAERILKQIKEKPSIKRVGLELRGSGPPARRERNSSLFNIYCI